MSLSNFRRHVLFALVLALAGAVPALGQVDLGIVADPIGRDELDDYTRRLGLSEQQRRAVDDLHDAYLTEYRAAQSGPLTAFHEAHRDFSNTTTEIGTDVDAAKSAVRDVRKLHATLRSADERFFDQINPLLAETQLVRLPAVRAARARWRDLHGPIQLSYHPALDVDLSSVYVEFADALPPDLRAVTDAIVAQYAAELGRAADRVNDFAVEYKRDQVERLAAANAASVDPEAGDWAIRASLLREGQTALAHRAAEIGALHRRLYTSLSDLLPPKTRDALRRRFLTSLYRGVPAERGLADTELARVLNDETLPAELLAQVGAERMQYRTAVARVIDKMLDTVDARRRSNASHSIRMMLDDDDYIYEDPKIFERQLDVLKRQLTRVNRETIERVQAWLDDAAPGVMTLRRPARDEIHPALASQGLHSSVSMTDGEAIYGYKHIPIAQILNVFGSGRRTIGPISKNDLSRWQRMIGLSADETVLMEVLHDDYRNAYDDLRKTGALGALARVRDGLLALDDAGIPALPTEDDARDLFRRERAALAAVRTLDGSFFAELSVALGDALSDADRQRLERDRSRSIFMSLAPPSPYSLFTFGAARSRGQRGAERPEVDVAAIVSELELDEEAAEALGSFVLEYEVAATALFERASDAATRLDEERALLMARHLRFHEEDGIVADDVRAPASMDEVGDTMYDTFDELLALNRALRTRVESVLTEPNLSTFSAAYQRAAWPRVFEDELAAHGVLEAALALDDLGARQREALAEMSLAYKDSYAALCDRIIEHADDWREQNRYGTERKDLNERIRRDVANLLAPEQRRRVIGLTKTEGS